MTLFSLIYFFHVETFGLLWPTCPSTDLETD